MSVWKYLTREMPLEDILDYDGYWDNRSDDEVSLEKMLPNHRKRVLAEQVIVEGDSILDVGCGECSFFDVIRLCGKRVEYIGYDIFEGLDAIGREKGIEVHNTNVLEAVTPMVDYVTLLNVLEHVHHPEAFLAHFRGRFRKSMFISVPNIGSIKNRVRLGLFGRFPISGVYYHISEHIRFWTFHDFLHWAEHYGYDVVRYWGAGKMTRLVARWPQYFSENILYELRPRA